jgi:putative transposase
LYAAQLMAEQAEVFEVPGDAMARYRLWQQLDRRQAGGDVLSEAEARWYGRYPSHPDFGSIQRMFDHAAEMASA